MINYDNHRIKINDKWLIICIGDIASSINDHISLLRYETSMIDVEIFWLLCFDSHSKPSVQAIVSPFSMQNLVFISFPDNSGPLSFNGDGSSISKSP